MNLRQTIEVGVIRGVAMAFVEVSLVDGVVLAHEAALRLEWGNRAGLFAQLVRETTPRLRTLSRCASGFGPSRRSPG